MTQEVVISAHEVLETVQTLASYFDTKIKNEHSELIANIPESEGTGFISAFDFKTGLGMVMFNCNLKNDLILRFNGDGYQPLRMIFCLENDFKHIIKKDGLEYQLTNLLGSIVAGTSKKEQLFLIPARKQVYFYFIEIDRKKYLPKIKNSVNQLPKELKEIFMDTKGTRPFLYQGRYSLSIAQNIQNIKHNPYTGLVRRIYMESQTLEIMAMQIKQFTDDLEPSVNHFVLRKKDMELIIEARKKLLSDLVNPPNIKDLGLYVGLNENKLKKGFMLLYKTSINKLLQNERLSRAKLLIAEEIYPIKDIAKMVGYKHSGHFTSKFKKQFGVLPKDYIKTMGL
jgi:AraC-like DNA-binding protein